jgi:hypothetical protein
MSRGFALSIVKPRSIALFHESGGSASGGSLTAASKPLSTPASSSPASGGGAVAVNGALAAALEGVHVYVHGGVSQLSGNTRGAIGVVDAEYADMDGDEVSGCV